MWGQRKSLYVLFNITLGDSKVTGMVKGMIQWDCKPDDDYRSGASLHGSTTQMKARLNPQERFRLDTCILRQIFWLPQ